MRNTYLDVWQMLHPGRSTKLNLKWAAISSAVGLILGITSGNILTVFCGVPKGLLIGAGIGVATGLLCYVFICFICQPKLKIYPFVTLQTYGAADQILNEVKSCRVKLINDPADSHLVLLLCVVISRVGSDMEEAMMRIPDAARQKPVFLVVMHHTREEDCKTDGTQWNKKYNNVKFHTDVLFHESKNGLLQCDRNSKAIMDLRKSVRAMKTRGHHQ